MRLAASTGMCVRAARRVSEAVVFFLVFLGKGQPRLSVGQLDHEMLPARSREARLGEGFPLALPILSAGPGPGVDDIVFYLPPSALLFPVSPAAASIVA